MSKGNFTNRTIKDFINYESEDHEKSIIWRSQFPAFNTRDL